MGAFKVKKIVKMVGVSPTAIAVDAGVEIVKWISSIVDEEQERLGEFKRHIEHMPDQELRETFVPDVYQKSIYRISYTKLKASGIKLISFDIDDTFGDVFLHNLHKIIHPHRILAHDDAIKAKKLVGKLHHMGFKVVLLTNAGETIAKGVCKQIGADDYYFKAHKPDTKCFNKIMKKYKIDRSQMAHVGNNIRQDVGGGNAAGVTTCLVRNRGLALKVGKILKKPIGLSSKGHLVRDELKKRRIWRKHRKFDNDDQYYQLGETQKYSSNFKG